MKVNHKGRREMVQNQFADLLKDVEESALSDFVYDTDDHSGFFYAVRFRFPNGFGASLVVAGDYQNLLELGHVLSFELAVIRFDGDSYSLVCDNEGEQMLLSCLRADEVFRTLLNIKNSKAIVNAY